MKWNWNWRKFNAKPLMAANILVCFKILKELSRKNQQQHNMGKSLGIRQLICHCLIAFSMHIRKKYNLDCSIVFAHKTVGTKWNTLWIFNVFDLNMFAKVILSLTSVHNGMWVRLLCRQIEWVLLLRVTQWHESHIFWPSCSFHISRTYNCAHIHTIY